LSLLKHYDFSRVDATALDAFTLSDDLPTPAPEAKPAAAPAAKPAPAPAAKPEAKPAPTPAVKPAAPAK